MKLQLKFSLIFSLVFGLGILIAAYWWHNALYRNAQAAVMQQARLMMQSSLSARNYTTEQIKPLIDLSHEFRAQTVPAYAATEEFGYLHKSYPDYSYKEATLNPTNLRDRATDWESDIIHAFRDDANKKEISGERDTPAGKSLFLARPITAAAPCLECHSTPQVAPVNMVRQYGPSNGFGWQKNEIIGAQIVSVPLDVSNRMAQQEFSQFITALVLIALALLVALNVVLYFAVVRPVRLLATMSDSISKGNLEFPELPVRGQDEIASLAAAFNRMHRSLSKAMSMLEQKSDGE